jgi:hypothetical protein
MQRAGAAPQPAPTSGAGGGGAAAPPAGGAQGGPGAQPISGIPNLDQAAINLNVLREHAKLELIRVLDSVRVNPPPLPPPPLFLAPFLFANLP